MDLLVVLALSPILLLPHPTVGFALLFPFTDVGPAQFQPMRRALYPLFLSDPSANLPHVHDFFLQLAPDFGIPGAVNLAFLFAACRHRPPLETRALAVGLGCGVVASFTYGVTDAITPGAIGSMALWVYVGLTTALAQTQPAPVGCSDVDDRRGLGHGARDDHSTAEPEPRALDPAVNDGA